MGLLGPDKNSFYSKGLKKIQKGDFLGAIKHFDNALAFDPEFVAAWCDKGVAYNNMGHNQEAIECYEKAIELDPEFIRALYNKSAILYVNNDFEGALKCTDKMLEMPLKESDKVNILNNKGMILSKLGKYREALEYYNNALEINPLENTILENKKELEEKIRNIS